MILRINLGTSTVQIDALNADHYKAMINKENSAANALNGMIAGQVKVDQINAVNKRLKNDPREKAFADAGKALDKKMTEVEEALIQTKAKSGQDVLNFPVRLNNHIAALGGVVESADSAPTAQSYEVFDMLSKQLDEQLAKWKAIVATDVANYNSLVKQQDVPMLLLANPEAGK